MSSKRGSWAFLVVSLIALIWNGCAASKDKQPDRDDDDGAAVPSGTGGQGGQAVEVSPCGIDCATIATTQCQQGICNEQTKQCEIVAADDGAACDDSLFCTLDDSCLNGECTGGPQNTCDSDPAQCQDIICNESSKSCSMQPSADGSPCQTDNLCDVNASCTNGLCFGSPKDCFFAPTPNDCYVAVCNPQNGLCEPEPGNEGASCSDPFDLCTEGKTCNQGACIGGAPKDCSSWTQGCQHGVCDSASGQCTQIPITDGLSCDDYNLCTVGEECQSGICGGGTTTTNCQNGDGCCPSGCDEGNDSDCKLRILLIGDDVSDNPVTGSDWQTYRVALTNAGVNWSEHNLDTNSTFPDTATLNQYNTIIWFDQGYVFHGNTECQRVADWLDSTVEVRNLFVTGGDMMADWATALANSGEHNLYSLWGMTYMGTSAGKPVVTLDGVASDPISGDFVAPNGLMLSSMPVIGSNGGDYVDETITSGSGGSGGSAGTGGSGGNAGMGGSGGNAGMGGSGGSGGGNGGNTGVTTHAALYTGGNGPGIGHSGLAYRSTANYKVVWLGVHFHHDLTSQSQRNQLMSNILTYFSD